jgi:hypothetical protein
MNGAKARTIQPDKTTPEPDCPMSSISGFYLAVIFSHLD